MEKFELTYKLVGLRRNADQTTILTLARQGGQPQNRDSCMINLPTDQTDGILIGQEFKLTLA